MTAPLRVVAGAVVRGGRVLVARRGPGQSLAGFWELPGGKVEPDESDAEALVRELQEELEIRVRVVDALGESAWTAGQRDILLVAYTCELVHGEPRALEHDALAWRDASGLEDLDWAPADRPLLAPLREVLVSGLPGASGGS